MLQDAMGLTQADLARAAGVTRQAVSTWMKQSGPDGIHATASSLVRLARNLGIDLSMLTQPLPDSKNEKTALLWDRLYSSLTRFLLACSEGEGRALARLVEVYGLLVAARLFGKRTWRQYPEYRNFIQPVRRKECDLVWKIVSSPT